MVASCPRHDMPAMAQRVGRGPRLPLAASCVLCCAAAPHISTATTATAPAAPSARNRSAGCRLRLTHPTAFSQHDWIAPPPPLPDHSSGVCTQTLRTSLLHPQHMQPTPALPSSPPPSLLPPPPLNSSSTLRPPTSGRTRTGAPWRCARRWRPGTTGAAARAAA